MASLTKYASQMQRCAAEMEQKLTKCAQIHRERYGERGRRERGRERERQRDRKSERFKYTHRRTIINAITHTGMNGLRQVAVAFGNCCMLQ